MLQLDAALNVVATVTPVTSLPLFDVAFFDDRTGFAGGGSAKSLGDPRKVPGPVLLRTEDGGATWVSQEIPYGWAELEKIAFFDRSHGVAFGLGIALRTADGGQTWVAFAPGLKGSLPGFARGSGPGTGFILGLGGGVVRTDDAGTAWRKVAVPTDSHLYCGSIGSDGHGLLGGAEHVVVTRDGGETWTRVPDPPGEFFQALFVDDQTWFGFGRRYSGGDMGMYQPVVYATRDAGKTWQQQALTDLDGVPESLLPLPDGSYLCLVSHGIFQFRLLTGEAAK